MLYVIEEFEFSSFREILRVNIIGIPIYSSCRLLWYVLIGKKCESWNAPNADVGNAFGRLAD